MGAYRSLHRSPEGTVMTLTPSDFTADARVRTAVAHATECVRTQPPSDLKDDAGHAYVDLVLEGGGVLGIALVGYTYVLEQAGLRFRAIAGTSAGAINALLLAACGRPHEARSEHVLAALAAMPLGSFLDGDADARDFSRALSRRAGSVKLFWKGAQVLDNLREDLGLHPGIQFATWLEERLAEHGVRSLAELETRIAIDKSGPHRLRTERRDVDVSSLDGELAIVAADATFHRKVVLPRMADQYYDHPARVNPARFVRASMAVPLFFAPARSDRSPEPTVCRQSLLVDGGVLYNFPIGIFHRHDCVPAAPTFGVKLELDRFAPIETPLHMVSAIFDTARSGLQEDFLLDNPDYRHLVANIDTGDAHYWLDFELSADAKHDLFVRGAQRAAAFLGDFDWEGYKEVRRLKAEVRRASPERKSLY